VGPAARFPKAAVGAEEQGGPRGLEMRRARMAGEIEFPSLVFEMFRSLMFQRERVH